MSSNSSAVPPSIFPLIESPPLLKGESRQQYNELLAALVGDVVPADIPEWLWLIQFLDCSWEIWRNRGYRAKVAEWHIKQMSSGYSAEYGSAMAFVRSIPSIDAIDRILEKLQRRCDTILQQLEFRRDVFAVRARRAAENVLREVAQSVPSIPAPPTVPPLPKSGNECAHNRNATGSEVPEATSKTRAKASGQTTRKSSEKAR
jgi:hypothetical protein